MYNLFLQYFLYLFFILQCGILAHRRHHDDEEHAHPALFYISKFVPKVILVPARGPGAYLFGINQ